jgi:cytoskeleton protein RodZ
LEIGATLRQARASLGYSLDQAAAATHIRRSFLVAIESDNLAALPPPVYARGILRTYALYLNLDPGPLLNSMPEPEEVEIESPPPVSLGTWRAQGSWAIGGIVVVLLVVTLLYLQGLAASGTDSSAPLLLELPTSTSTPPPTATVPPGSTTLPTLTVTPTATPQASLATATPGAGSPTPTPATSPVAVVLAIVPNVVGQPLTSAETTLRNAGFNVQHQEQSGGTPGQVMAQEPSGGQSLAPGGAVLLRVGASATQDLTVPEVVGRPEAEARDMLRKAGLNPSPWTNYQDLEALPPALRKPVCVGCVLSSSPPTGSQVNPGATVNLAVRGS